MPEKQLQRVEYIPSENKMTVAFKGKFSYSFFNVPEVIHENFKNDDYSEDFFFKNILNDYNYKLLWNVY